MVTITVPSAWELYLFSCVGALLLWTKLTVEKKKIHGFFDVISKLIPDRPNVQYTITFVTLVLLGGFIGVLFVGPYTHLQAVAGGVAWSRLAARD
jgi:hypothetical protein